MTVLATPLTKFDVDPERGYLPASDPLTSLPPGFEPWEETAAQLPKLLMTTKLRRTLERMPVLDPAPLQTAAELERAMMLLSYLGHAHVWGGGKEPATSVPAPVAVPWYQVAQKLQRPPVLSYPSYALHNWRRIDTALPVALGNIALLQNFWGGADEEWFVLVHVDIEKKAAPALTQLFPAQDAALAGDITALTASLQQIGAALDEMMATMRRMPEFCDPYIYFHRVRPYIFGWKDQPALPDGLVYEGVDEYGGIPQRFRGETGAQSAIVPALDAVLGVTHAADPLRAYLMEMRDYMSSGHRAFITALEDRPSVRDVVMRQHGEVVDAYDHCVEDIHAFRALHLEYAATYIQRQAHAGDANPNEVGTGGTPFMRYLKKHRDETGNSVLSSDHS
jgi:indoleamine 2,3-dioxygenase